MSLEKKCGKETKVGKSQTKLSKKKKMALSPFAGQRKVQYMCCPKCGKLLSQPNAVRLKPCPKLSKHLQKLLRKRAKDENSLTSRQQELLHRAMQQNNALKLQCDSCQWKGIINLQSRDAIQRQKAKFRQKAKKELSNKFVEVIQESSAVPDRKTLKKLKKKERRKKNAKAKALELQTFQRFKSEETVAETAAVPISTATEADKLLSSITQSFSRDTKIARKPDILPVKSEKARASGIMSGVKIGKISKKGKQQLQNALNQQKKTPVNVRESLSQFLDSLK